MVTAIRQVLVQVARMTWREVPPVRALLVVFPSRGLSETNARINGLVAACAMSCGLTCF